MKNYDHLYPGFFNCTEEEAMKLPLNWEYTREKFVLNFNIIVKTFGAMFKIDDFTIRKVPHQRSKWDQARLLVIKLDDGSFMAKRVNRNQWLPLEF